MDIPQRIDEIIQKRKQLLDPIEETIQHVMEARSSVLELDSFRTTQNNELPPELVEQLQSISTQPFYSQCDNAINALEHLKLRFSRESVNISFVGRAGQGKSLVLQRISGLEGDVIPSANGSDCTGARSIISNSPEITTTAEITFYSEKEIVEIVNKYLHEILKTHSYDVTNVNGISNLDIETIKNKVSKQTIETSLVDHLEKYVNHIQELKDKLGTIITVSKNEIESYVAQYNSKNHQEKYFTYLVVKGANIKTHFPCEDCGKIVLVDTIGTGATALGVEDEMLATVRDDSDAIVLMMRPETLRPRIDREDYRLLQAISDKVSKEYASEMLFWVINRVEEGPARNADNIHNILAQVSKQDLAVAEYLNVNCMDREDVEKSLLHPVLDRLSNHLYKIDQMILERVNEQLKNLEETFHQISARVERAVGASINQDERREFDRKIRAIIKVTTNSLRNLFLAQGEHKDDPCEPLQQAASEKLKDVLRSLPSKSAIIEMLNDGTINQHNALEKLADKLRLQIINDFLGLNSSLHEFVLQMKSDVVKVLGDEEKGGRLNLIIRTDPSDPDAWLGALEKELNGNKGEFPLLLEALHPLVEFDLRMENFLIYKVRCCLRPIDWSANERVPEIKNTLNDKDAMANEIRDILAYYLNIVHNDIRNELRGFYTFPNTALYAVLRDFYDRTVCSCGEDGFPVLDEWKYLYEDKIPKIWENEHKNYMAAAGRAKEWGELTSNIYSCAADGYFLINTGKRK